MVISDILPGVRYDTLDRSFAIWTTCPKRLLTVPFPDRKLYDKGLLGSTPVFLKRRTVKSGRVMLVLEGTIPESVRPSKGLFLDLREHLTTYINAQ